MNPNDRVRLADNRVLHVQSVMIETSDGHVWLRGWL
jgi:hypothetical protein